MTVADSGVVFKLAEHQSVAPSLTCSLGDSRTPQSG